MCAGVCHPQLSETMNIKRAGNRQQMTADRWLLKVQPNDSKTFICEISDSKPLIPGKKRDSAIIVDNLNFLKQNILTEAIVEIFLFSWDNRYKWTLHGSPSQRRISKKLGKKKMFRAVCSHVLVHTGNFERKQQSIHQCREKRENVQLLHIYSHCIKLKALA